MHGFLHIPLIWIIEQEIDISFSFAFLPTGPGHLEQYGHSEFKLVQDTPTYSNASECVSGAGCSISALAVSPQCSALHPTGCVYLYTSLTIYFFPSICNIQ
jgi:hypothetical protein